jgi:hypothetical protein
MATEFRQLRCKCLTRGVDNNGMPKVCNSFLGNIEAYKEVLVQVPCHQAAGHIDRDKNFMTEWHQNEYGSMGYRVLSKKYKARYVEDDQIFPRGENG